MSCRPGHSWLSVQSDACFDTASGFFRSCYCPFSTCVEVSPFKHECRLTDLVYAVIGVLFLLFWFFVFLYLWVNPRWTELFASARNRKRGELPLPARIYRQLFPEDFPASQRPGGLQNYGSMH
jgi:hypothetical protein